MITGREARCLIRQSRVRLITGSAFRCARCAFSTRSIRMHEQSLNEKSTKTVFLLEDLPKIDSGALGALPQTNGREDSEKTTENGVDDEELEFTTFYQQIKNTIDKYSSLQEEYVVLIQVGSFYELYFEQAEKYAGVLGISLTKKKLKKQDVAFAGFPDYRLNKYLNLIFKLGLKAVVCDQVADKVTNRIERPVTRLITPGTVMEDEVRDYHYNNYLLTISFPDDPFKDLANMKIGLAWADVGLGNFHILETNLNDLMPNITRINPSEIVIDRSIDTEKLVSGRWYPELGDIRNYYITRRAFPSSRKKLSSFLDRFQESPRLMTSLIETWSTKEKAASTMLLNYLDECIPNYNVGFSLPQRSLPESLMSIDSRAATDLELTSTIRGGFKTGALSTVLDHTYTPQGSRLLKTWLLSPSTDVAEISRRQKFVRIFLKYRLITDELRSLLKNMSDVNRILRRIANSRAEASELLDLSRTVFLIQEMKLLVETSPAEFKRLIKSCLKIDEEIAILARTISEQLEPSSESLPVLPKIDFGNQNRAWSVKPSSSAKLMKLKEEFNEHIEKQSSLEEEVRESLLKHGFTGSLKFSRDLRTGEFVIDVRSSSKSLTTVLESSGISYKDKNKSGAKIISNEWKRLGHAMIYLSQAIFEEEDRLIEELKNSVLGLSHKFRKLSPNIEFLDLMMSFAELSRDKNLVCPEVNEETELVIHEGRHVVVEEGLKDSLVVSENFTSNSCELDSKGASAWVITGPNMGGKSTFLRQNAIIVIMAQMGCYVPAASANIGVIDKIFTRVGSSDNIYRHQSTFMVEMNETAVILRDATPRSLAIVDELGRGTSTREGIAVAFASLSYLVKNSSCKVLFATHYGPEIAELISEDEELAKKVKFYMSSATSVRRSSTVLPIDEKLIFDHTLREGISDHSHALDIAEISGFPGEAIKLAEKALLRLNESES
ncbi:unnamed protein product [Kuraishia capsulata CBS 1993]|uniref:DNA mismatch repair proteins mutS family domain-containing protein n=1 Tax=Kuraishia capsulata CBS 1993 TaxID=1382522 RepID=W6MTD4_9ASCO|nr:uncharacterized protein KUCA_T00005681001 [Kuraishia capsulata CBS 1993]CDK29688.1 unnamed protein product [Kuraishia capsulata CBS 1993]